MNTLIILCNPHENSFNHLITSNCINAFTSTNSSVIVHDLYLEKFDPVLTAQEIYSKFSFDSLVADHTDALQSADQLIIIHPDWWGGPPALLKGWIDRVLKPGVAYLFEGAENSKKTKTSLLSEKKIAVIVTTDAKETQGQTLTEQVWRKSVWGYCGVENLFYKTHFNTRSTGPHDRQVWIDDLKTQLQAWCKQT